MSKNSEDMAKPDESPDKDVLSRFFDFKGNGTNYRREIIAGVTTFLAMSYIIFVNPNILSAAGMPKDALFTATALAAVAGCLLMAFVARYPVAIAPSMGLNAFFAFSVVKGMGIPWETALVAVFIAGVAFVVITVLKLREMILNAIPPDLKMASAAGIGLFIAFIGLKNAGMITSSQATLVTLGSLTDPTTALSIFGLVATIGLMIRDVPGAIFFGMVMTSILGIVTMVIPVPGAIVSSIPSVQPIFGVAITRMFEAPGEVFTLNLLIAAFIFLFVEFFDTAGTLMAIATKAGLMKDNQMVRGGRALMADSSSVVAASVMGTSPTTSFIESTTGVAAGGRTGMVPFVVAILFGLAMFFSPLLAVVTSNVTAPALIIVGMLMASVLSDIDWQRLEVAAPAFLMIVTMPLTYSIANGVALGLVVYPFTMLVKGRIKEVHPIMGVLFVIFVLYFAFLA